MIRLGLWNHVWNWQLQKLWQKQWDKGGHLLNSLTMIPAIPYAVHRAVAFMPGSNCLAPLLYAIMCVASAVHHFHVYKHGHLCTMRFKLDMIMQLFACMATIAHTRPEMLALIMASTAVVTAIDLHNERQRRIGYAINGLSVMLSSGPHVAILCHWLASFCIFAGGVLYLNNYTHGIFHIYNHYIIALVWNTI